MSNRVVIPVFAFGFAYLLSISAYALLWAFDLAVPFSLFWMVFGSVLLAAEFQAKRFRSAPTVDEMRSQIALMRYVATGFSGGHLIVQVIAAPSFGTAELVTFGLTYAVTIAALGPMHKWMVRKSLEQLDRKAE